VKKAEGKPGFQPYQGEFFSPEGSPEGTPKMSHKDSSEEIERWNAEGRELLEKGDMEGALEKFSRALDLLGGDDDRAWRAGLLNNLGLVQVRLARFEEAQASFQQAAEDYRKMGKMLAVAALLGNAGSTCRDTQAHDRALTFYNESFAIYSEHEHPMGMADQAGNIGYIYAMKNDPRNALEWFGKALAIYRQEGEEKKAELTGRNIEALRSAAGKE
jgi:tetratricopeptide (TPR) repeat protein